MMLERFEPVPQVVPRSNTILLVKGSGTHTPLDWSKMPCLRIDIVSTYVHMGILCVTSCPKGTISNHYATVAH